MKKTLTVLMVLVFITFSFGLVKSVVIATGEFPPFTSEKMKGGGFITRIVTESFKISGVDVKYIYYPWSRAYDIVLKGDADITPFWTKTPERERDFYLSDNIESFYQTIFFLKQTNFSWKKIEDLKAYKIGITKEYSYGELFDNAVKNNIISVDEGKSDEFNLRKLLAGRIELFIGEKNMTLYLIKSLGKEEASKITYSTNYLAENSSHILVSKKIKNGKEIVDLFNKGLKKLKDSGQYDKIKKEYF